ncbi:alpha/beta hydrolase [Bacillus suaedaesalsae]|uniref:Alpha/beta hydrolase n=1 Tax=Bacillus suaedaesalsae TaxID=2810349 RepID=A0ABS2DLX0_9BACI|nr:alpha/beta hydrolase [Bacillus suaedaesalsae]MBM6619478.1 alpha/beta hydrolase [Bacillus suaedaesalsae]
MEHIFVQGQDANAPVLLLLHGTGGNERDLLPLANMIAPHASVLGVRGNVLENGMPRFFRRLSEGVFDEEDLVFRTKELQQFLDEMAEKYLFDRNKLVALGYSNGANIAASLLYHFKNTLRGAILFHAMVPLRGIDVLDLSNTPVFIGAGKYDPLIPKAETSELIEALRKANSPVQEFWTDGGHELRREEVDEAKDWFEKKF